jgi:hypothetical protein
MSENITEKQIKSRTRHKFLGEYFFPNATGYSVNKVNDDWVLVRQFNATLQEWEVAIYTKESYEKAEAFYLSQKNMFDSPSLAG